MALTRCEQTDRQSDRVIPIYPQNFVCEGYSNGIHKGSKNRVMCFYNVLEYTLNLQTKSL